MKQFRFLFLLLFSVTVFSQSTIPQGNATSVIVNPGGYKPAKWQWIPTQSTTEATPSFDDAGLVRYNPTTGDFEINNGSVWKSYTGKFIKTNESLTSAQRKGDVLYGILDQYTGEEVVLSKVTGTPTVDNIIYFQLGSEYFIRNVINNTVDVRIFGATTSGSSTTAFTAADAYPYVKQVDQNYTINANLNTLYKGKGVVTNDGYANNLSIYPKQIIKNTIEPIVFTGSGLNDLDLNGGWLLPVDGNIIIEILLLNQTTPDSGLSDTFRYSVDGGVTWVDDDLVIDPETDEETLLPLFCKDHNWPVGYSGVLIDFAAATGHTIGNTWEADFHPVANEINYNGEIKQNNKTVIQFREKEIIIGKDSGSNSSIGIHSIILGYDAYQNNTTGGSNLGAGRQVLKFNTTGSLNVGLGDFSLSRNTTGRDNTFTGVYSGFDNTIGYGNTGTGQDVLRYNQTGNENTAGGAQALYFNEVSGITGFGTYAVRGNKTGIANAGFGKGSLFKNENGNYNFGGGSESLYNLVGGNSNTGLGESAGFRLTTGNNSTFIGRASGGNILQKVDATNSTAIGANSYTDADNQMVLGDENLTDIIPRSTFVHLGSSEKQFLSFYSNKIIASDYVTVGGDAAPVSGVHLQVRGESTAQPTVYIYNPNTAAGTSRGITVQGGTNSTDFATAFETSTGVRIMTVQGDGQVTLNNDATNPNAAVRLSQMNTAIANRIMERADADTSVRTNTQLNAAYPTAPARTFIPAPNTTISGTPSPVIYYKTEAGTWVNFPGAFCAP